MVGKGILSRFTSVVIPTFNRRKFLRVAITSASEQIKANTEIIVIDDGSNDGTKEMLVNLGLPIKYVFQKHTGLAAARNSGLRVAKGDYVLFLDSDDLITYDKIYSQMKMLESDQNKAAVYSQWQYVNADGSLIGEDGADQTLKILPKLLYTNIAPIHSFLFRADALRQIGGFDENLPSCEDWDILLRLILAKYKFIFMPRVTALYRIHKDNMSSNAQLMLDGRLKVIEKTFIGRRLHKRYKYIYMKARCITFLDTIWQCLKRGCYRGAQKNMLRMITYILSNFNSLTYIYFFPEKFFFMLEEYVNETSKIGCGDFLFVLNLLNKWIKEGIFRYEYQ